MCIEGKQMKKYYIIGRNLKQTLDLIQMKNSFQKLDLERLVKGEIHVKVKILFKSSKNHGK
jgi:hypothetical protein